MLRVVSATLRRGSTSFRRAVYDSRFLAALAQTVSYNKQLVNRVSLQGTVFLLLFWMLAEVALLWEEARFLAEPRIVVESSRPEIQVAEFPEEPSDPYEYLRLLAARSHP